MEWFPEEEYFSRWERVRGLMAEEGLDALLITSDPNYRYFTGHRPFCPWATLTRANIVLIPLSDEPVILAHLFHLEDVKASSPVKDIRPYSDLTSSPLDQLMDALSSRRLLDKTIGAELGREQRLGIPFSDLIELQRRAPKALFRDGSEAIWKTRMIKSEREISYLRKACEITSSAYEKGFPRIRRGMREREIASLLTTIMIEEGADAAGFFAMVSGAGNYKRVSGTPTERRIDGGDLLHIDTGAIYRGYWADFSRAGVVGGAAGRQEDLQRRLIEVTARGVEAIGPGVPVRDVVEACGREMKTQGLDFSFGAGRVGHGIGLMLTELPHIAYYDETILGPGMAVSVEPGIVEDCGIFHVEEVVLVTEKGREVLSDCPRHLRKIGG